MFKKPFLNPFFLVLHILPKMIVLNTGRIPMRHLVYRVRPLPQSMLPLVWDFGQLDNNVEKLYIIQMVQRCVSIILLIISRNVLIALHNIYNNAYFHNKHVLPSLIIRCHRL